MRGSRFCRAVSRRPDNGKVAKESTRPRDGNIRSTEVNSIGLGGRGDLRVVVDDENRVGRNFPQFLG
jgi:hypothetical protein